MASFAAPTRPTASQDACGATGHVLKPRFPENQPAARLSCAQALRVFTYPVGLAGTLKGCFTGDSEGKLSHWPVSDSQ